ncbi:glycosyltransferase [Modestobacter sp. SSW1-42]|uniref:glycosyltransferase n=1 Tax=Modestobacter sp. SSW1-42 TaxID=596372 RepID=UPI003986425D
MDRPLVVLQSFPTPRPTTNPYIVMLGQSLAATPGVELLTFTWRRFLLGRFDVFHAHWPEILVSGQSPLKALVRQLLFLVALVRLRLTRRPLVRTVHNLELPQGISRRETALLRLADRWTTLRIRINESTGAVDDEPVETIVHGHYRDWFAAHPRSEVVSGRLTFFGQVRRYKNVDRLLEVFAATGDLGQPLSLRVIGRPTSEELAAELRAAVDPADPRISLDLDFVADPQLVAEVSAAELVVLPYREMHNSGSTLTALSLDRPVLVPDNAVNRALGEEVGGGWVLRYPGPFTADSLLDALRTLRATPPAGRPDLHRREWDGAGLAHLAAYRRAVDALRRTPA